MSIVVVVVVVVLAEMMTEVVVSKIKIQIKKKTVNVLKLIKIRELFNIEKNLL